MATILRRWSYQYPILYNTISRLSALMVGGEDRFRRLALQGLKITPQTRVLDLCCGPGEATAILTTLSEQVTGLDISPVALSRAAQRAPKANYVEGLAQELPFSDQEFDLVHTSVALHEMNSQELAAIWSEVYRVLKVGGVFTLIDFHPPTNPLFWPALATFLWLFETETAWQLLETNLVSQLEAVGFQLVAQHLYAGGSLQVIQVKK